LLIPTYGILGAAIATTTSLLTGVVIVIVVMPKVLKVRIDIKWFARAMGLACIAVALFFAVKQVIHPYIVAGVILSGYTASVIIVFLTREDRRIIKELAYSLVRRR
jgi:O-antigen/teichoic acid export membrane protein